eukprot:6209091-Alexandrium_andersonii.AAC.1
MTHFPKKPRCPACQRANARRVQMRAILENSYLGKHAFGRRVTNDHAIASSAGSRGLHGETSALCVRDFGTYYIE